MDNIVIAIDGTSASGKGTLAKNIADHFDFAYLDTGKLYRYVGYKMVENGADPSNAEDAAATAKELSNSLNEDDLTNLALLSDEAGKAASLVGVHKDVRSALLEFQRKYALNPPNSAKGAILDGRDIGTIICPDANLKFYVDADIEIRAKRRHKELQSLDIPGTYEAVLADMRERDERDSQRQIAALKPAQDAIIIDTSDMNQAEALEHALSIIKDRLSF